jgi:hypothetical protein
MILSSAPTFPLAVAAAPDAALVADDCTAEAAETADWEALEATLIALETAELASAVPVFAAPAVLATLCALEAIEEASDFAELPAVEATLWAEETTEEA